MNKKLIRLTESDLHRIVKESVEKILNEIGDTKKGRDDINTAMVNSVYNDHQKNRNACGHPAGGISRWQKRKRVNDYLKNGAHGKEWYDEHGKDWLFGTEDEN